MAVAELNCTVCDTVVRSQYAPCPFCRLVDEDQAFLLLFIRHRGNVKDMERELGVSYWTIRGRLNEVIELMGLDPGGEPAGDAPPPPAASTAPAAPPSPTRQAILDRLRRGELTAEEAAEQLGMTN